MANEPLSLQKIREQCPFPWVTHVLLGGRVAVVDSKGKEVPIFHMTRFCELLTAHFDKTQPTAAETKPEEPK